MGKGANGFLDSFSIVWLMENHNKNYAFRSINFRVGLIEKKGETKLTQLLFFFEEPLLFRNLMLQSSQESRDDADRHIAMSRKCRPNINNSSRNTFKVTPCDFSA